MCFEHARHLLARYLPSNIAFSTTFGGLINSVVHIREGAKVLKLVPIALQYTLIAVPRIPAVREETWEAVCFPTAAYTVQNVVLKKKKTLANRSKMNLCEGDLCRLFVTVRIKARRAEMRVSG